MLSDLTFLQVLLDHFGHHNELKCAQESTETSNSLYTILNLAECVYMCAFV